jgi:hypothetical protein
VQPGISIKTMPVGATVNLPPDPWAAAKGQCPAESGWQMWGLLVNQ